MQVSRVNWKYAAIPTAIVLFLAIYPQLNIWMVKGSAWNGSYVVSNYDEVAYSAYVNSLIEGRPRKNDPFIGRDNIEGETLYSIQFVPAFTIAYSAKAFGISTSSAFVILNFLIAIFSTLAVFFFVRSVTGDDPVSGVGALVVLLLGTAVAFQGELQHLTIGNYLCDFFPFLRRYQPGFAFPLFFVFCLLALRSLKADRTRNGLLYAAASGAVFVVLVFSYFFLWTAALAWFAVFALLWFVFRPDTRMMLAARAGVITAFAIAAIVPFFMLLSAREKQMDDVQLLDLTRSPNLFELPEIFGSLVTLGVTYLVFKKRVDISSPTTLATLSLALTPFALFNQQIVTGHSLQPVHYEIFIANYMILTSGVLLFWLIMSTAGELSAPRFKRVLTYVAAAAVIWGFVESSATTRRNAGYESLRDDVMPALTYLNEKEPAAASNNEYPAVMSSDLMVADLIPTVTSYRALWNPHTNSAGGVDAKENRELFYRYLYYSRFGEDALAKAMDDRLYEVVAAVFGGGRALPELSGGIGEITPDEKKATIIEFRDFVTKFDREQAYSPMLRFMIVPTEAEPDFANIDRWYVRDKGKTFGIYKLYKLTPKE